MAPSLPISRPAIFDDDLNAFRADRRQWSEELAHLSYIDGFLTSLVVGPTLVPPSEWLAALVETETGTLDADDTELMCTMLLAQYEAIAEELYEDLEAYEPLFWTDDNGTRVCRDWANGFFDAMRFCDEHWGRFFRDKESRDLILPILFQLDSDELRQMLSTGDLDLEEIAARAEDVITESVLALSDYWLAHGPARPQRRRKRAKVGRNAPCPCGSGKKYKKCCLH